MRDGHVGMSWVLWSAHIGKGTAKRQLRLPCPNRLILHLIPLRLTRPPVDSSICHLPLSMPHLVVSRMRSHTCRAMATHSPGSSLRAAGNSCRGGRCSSVAGSASGGMWMRRAQALQIGVEEGQCVVVSQ